MKALTRPSENSENQYLSYYECVMVPKGCCSLMATLEYGAD